MMGGDRKTLRNTVVLIAGLLVFWQLTVLVVGDVALRRRGRRCVHGNSSRRPSCSGVHLPNTLQAFARRARDRRRARARLSVSALGLHRLSGDAMEPMLVALYSIPKITLYPIVLLAFGLGMSAKIAFGAIHGIIPVALFALTRCATPSRSSSRPDAC